MSIFNYFKFPFKSVIAGYQSYKFFTALQNNKERKLHKMIKSSKNLINLQEINTHLSPLHVLIRESKNDLIEKVLARPDATTLIGLQNNPSKLAPIHVAAKYGATWVLNDFKKLNCNFMAKTEQGTTAIHIAASEGCNEFIDKLIEFGVQVDDKDKIGYTALFYAVLFSRLKTVTLLLEKGAKSGAQCEVGSTPLLNAVLKGDFEITKLLYRFKDGHKFKAAYKLVHIASGLQSEEIIKWLHEQGENISEVDSSGEKRGCLHYAAAFKATATLKYLLSNGLLVDTVDSTGSTPLHTAAIQGELETVKILCEAGAKINLKNDSFMSPLDIAESLRNQKLVTALKQYEVKG